MRYNLFHSWLVPVFVAITFGMLVTGTPAFAQQDVQLFSFNGGQSNGEQNGPPTPNGLIFDSSGNLYGTTVFGGTYNIGSVFELSPVAGGGWSEQTLYSFGLGYDGQQPSSSLVLDSLGNLYGTAPYGGENSGGIIFELSPSAGGAWTETVLHNFEAPLESGPDGSFPQAGITIDPIGNLYGTTSSGGAYNGGTVFELTPGAGGIWTEKLLHSFGHSKDGFNPHSSLIFDSGGNLYGTTVGGGPNGDGAVFKLTPKGGGNWSEEILHSFTYGTIDGVGPQAGLVLDAAGNLYGTTTAGGIPNSNGAGVVFELSPTASGPWTEKILHTFYDVNGSDGYYPLAGVVFDGAGNLYGTAYRGGSWNGGGGAWGDGGVVFELTPVAGGGWTYSLPCSFGVNGRDGSAPAASLVLDSSGNLYGTTAYGGSYDGGTVFEVKSPAPSRRR